MKSLFGNSYQSSFRADHSKKPLDGQRVKPDIIGQPVPPGCSSWHHQAVKSVENTRLAVTGYTETDGIKMIEAIERKDKTFAVGLQFHPEAALVRHMENAGNQDDYMDYDTALSIFQWIVQENDLEQKDAA